MLKKFSCSPKLLLAWVNHSRILTLTQRKSSAKQASGAQMIICSMLGSENSRPAQQSANLFRIFQRLWWSRSRADRGIPTVLQMVLCSSAELEQVDQTGGGTADCVHHWRNIQEDSQYKWALGGKCIQGLVGATLGLGSRFTIVKCTFVYCNLDNYLIAFMQC